MENKGYELIFIRNAERGTKLLERMDHRFAPKGVSHLHVNLRDYIDEWEMFGAKVGVHFVGGEDPRAVAVSISGDEKTRDRAYRHLSQLAGGDLN